MITSRQNPRVKEAIRLRDRRQREKQGRILIDGARELRRAIGGGLKLSEVFVCEPLCTSDDAKAALAALPHCGGEVLHVAEGVLEKLAFGQRAEGLLGVAEMPRPTLETLSALLNSRGLTAPGGAAQESSPAVREANREALPPGYCDSERCGEGNGADTARAPLPLVAVLEGVEKPGNLGAVLRSADAAGVSAVIVADGRTDLFNPNAIRASLGTIFTLPVCEATSGEALAWLRQRGFDVFAARVDGAVPYTQADYRGPTAIVLGSEAAGLSPLWSGGEIRAIRLPMLGEADSLNVSATAAVLFYEALRQREAANEAGRMRDEG
jgi:TrmH family RNA methyltransferase